MFLKDFDYDFSPSQVAVAPTEPRRAARMMVIERKSGQAQNSKFQNLSDFLNSGDILVVNESLVLPARFMARRKSGAALEGLFLDADNNSVRVWLKGRVQKNERIEVEGFGDIEVLERNEKEAHLKTDPSKFIAYLKARGLMPLPPYIRSERQARGVPIDPRNDPQDYQSIFAEEKSEAQRHYSVAAPTASLHFDSELLESLKSKQIEIQKISLYVGEGTFAPVMVEHIEDHSMHFERCAVRTETFQFLQRAKNEGRRIIAVGTTAMRTLESAARRVESGDSIEDFKTDLFIRPPFEFRMVDGLITNFHWPKSTLIVLVATFLEAQNGLCKSMLHHRWRTYYDLAVRENYRLFSYGDGMLIL